MIERGELDSFPGRESDPSNAAVRIDLGPKLGIPGMSKCPGYGSWRITPLGAALALLQTEIRKGVKALEGRLDQFRILWRWKLSTTTCSTAALSMTSVDSKSCKLPLHCWRDIRPFGLSVPWRTVSEAACSSKSTLGFDTRSSRSCLHFEISREKDSWR